MLASVAEQIAAALHGVDRQGETVWDDSSPYPAPHPVFGRAQMTPAAAPSHGGLGGMVQSTGHPGLYMPYPGTAFPLLVVLQSLSLFEPVLVLAPSQLLMLMLRLALFWKARAPAIS